MAKKNSKAKKITKKAQQFFKTDMFQSLAIASVLLNILFIITLLVLTSTDTFDRRVYNAAKKQYCNNYDSIEARTNQLGSKKAALREKQIDCIGPDFEPYFYEAIDKYRAKNNAQ